MTFDPLNVGQIEVKSNFHVISTKICSYQGLLNGVYVGKSPLMVS